MFLGDFHIHSRFSDGILSVAEIVDLYGERGFGAIAITDHLCEKKTLFGRGARYLGRTLTEENFGEYLEVLRREGLRAWEQYRMILIPGVELTKNSWHDDDSAHVLALGLRDFIAPDEDVLKLIHNIHAQNALAIAAHPVHTQKEERQTFGLWNRREELAPHFDAWEVASGPHLFREVAATSLPKIANSDLHGPTQMKSWKTLLSCERHPEAILRSIKKQDIEFHFYDPGVLTAPRPRRSPSFADRIFDLSLSLF